MKLLHDNIKKLQKLEDALLKHMRTAADLDDMGDIGDRGEMHDMGDGMI